MKTSCPKDPDGGVLGEINELCHLTFNTLLSHADTLKNNNEILRAQNEILRAIHKNLIYVGLTLFISGVLGTLLFIGALR